MNQKKLDFVYIIGDRSQWMDGELCYSLRSLEKFVDHGRVFIVGRRPEWLKNVHHIEAYDTFTNKLKNAVSKIMTACESPDISDDFVLMNDDFFFLRPYRVGTETIGTLEQAKNNHSTKGGYYYQAIVDTQAALSAAGILAPINYEVHSPMIFNKKLFKRIMSALRWKDRGYLYRSIYGNMWGIEGKETADHKAYQFSDVAKLQKHDMISTDNIVARSLGFNRWIKERFPNPSKYEIFSKSPAAH